MNRRNFIKNTSITLSLSTVCGGLIPLLADSADNLGQSNLIAPNFHPMVGNRPKFPRKIKRPPRLKAGDTIALVAPAGATSEKQVQKAISNLEALQFKVIYSKNLLSRKGYLAGTDQQRAADLNRFFGDKNVQGIWCVRGGYGCMRILSMLDYKKIRKNPKVLVGYSDITALHQTLLRHSHLVSFHAPVAGVNFNDFALQQMQNVLMNPQKNQVIRYAGAERDDSTFEAYTIRSGRAEGRLVGGNLSLVSAMIGTPYALDFKNNLVFLEDIGEKPYSVDRMLTQLLLNGRLEKAAGIILGVFKGCEAKNLETSLSLSAVLKDRLAALQIPVLYGFSFGHISNNATIPVGIKARLDTESKELTLLESAVL